MMQKYLKVSEGYDLGKILGKIFFDDEEEWMRIQGFLKQEEDCFLDLEENDIVDEDFSDEEFMQEND